MHFTILLHILSYLYVQIFKKKCLNITDQPSCSSPLMSISDYSSYDQKNGLNPKQGKTSKTSKWAQFVEAIEIMSKNDSSDSESEKKEGFFDFLKLDIFERNAASTSSVKDEKPKKNIVTSKSLASSPMRVEIGKRSPILRCFDLPKIPVSEKIKDKVSSTLLEENLVKFMSTFPKRRSSTPSTRFLTQKRISELRESGAKTDSENDEVFLKVDGAHLVDSRVTRNGCSKPKGVMDSHRYEHILL